MTMCQPKHGFDQWSAHAPARSRIHSIHAHGHSLLIAVSFQISVREMRPTESSSMNPARPVNYGPLL